MNRFFKTCVVPYVTSPMLRQNDEKTFSKKKYILHVYIHTTPCSGVIPVRQVQILSKSTSNERKIKWENRIRWNKWVELRLRCKTLIIPTWSILNYSYIFSKNCWIGVFFGNDYIWTMQYIIWGICGCVLYVTEHSFLNWLTRHHNIKHNDGEILNKYTTCIT